MSETGEIAIGLCGITVIVCGFFGLIFGIKYLDNCQEISIMRYEELKSHNIQKYEVNDEIRSAMCDGKISINEYKRIKARVSELKLRIAKEELLDG